MSKSLLIVESPTKAKTLGRYLGKDFIVKASVGHVKDLPENTLGIDIAKGFKPNYRVMLGKKKIITELNEAAQKADAIFLGPDPDREGEAIAWHIAEELNARDKPIHRVLFYELTQKAIKEALANPKELNRNLYDAQQGRRILDRLVGYLISPLLWEKVKRGLSAGRVQSVALRLVCEREREIQAFEPQEYWTIDARLQRDGSPPVSFLARLARCGKKKCDIKNGDEANRLTAILNHAKPRVGSWDPMGPVEGEPLSYTVRKVEKKDRKRSPSPPFITSTLQQEAARKFRLSARRTMGIAQKLYEGIELGDVGAVGLITYMRTDSTRLSSEAVEAARLHIEEVFGKDYLPSKPIVYKSKQSAQGAHEAIRPTDVNRTPESMKRFLTSEQLNLYTLIWKRFVACQMAPAVITQTSAEIIAGEYTFNTSGSVIKFLGFMTLYVESQDGTPATCDDGENCLPELQEGQILPLMEIIPKQHFTQPPPRFSEASLIKELEELGIGRPSTYATILSTILDREYVSMVGRQLQPTELGWITNSLLVDNFADIIDVAFTAQMEKSLDEIEQGREQTQKLLSGFYEQFSGDLESAKRNMLNVKLEGIPTDLTCPSCSRPLFIRWGRNGPFLACSGYPECTFSSDYERDEKGRIQIREAPPSTGETCDKCGRPMVLKRGRFGTFLACSGYPECKNTRAPSTGIPCPREGCGGEMIERVGKSGRRFYGCNRYPECNITFWGKPVRKTCPSCGSPVLIEKQGKRGTKLVCPNSSCKHEEKSSLPVDREAAAHN